MTGDGRSLLVPNALDDTVSVVDVVGRRVVSTFPTIAGPYRLGTFGPEGPSKPVGPATPAPGTR
jgi:YVTN family beta-propeller protein